jgi:hypothetical protein
MQVATTASRGRLHSQNETFMEPGRRLTAAVHERTCPLYPPLATELLRRGDPPRRIRSK